MKNAPPDVPAPKTYTLTEEAYEELKCMQTMLLLMARIAYGDNDEIEGNTKVTLERAQLGSTLKEVGVRIGEALEDIVRDAEEENAVKIWH